MANRFVLNETSYHGAGGAIGLDRLLMVEYGGEEIAPLLSFPMNALFER